MTKTVGAIKHQYATGTNLKNWNSFNYNNNGDHLITPHICSKHFDTQYYPVRPRMTFATISASREQWQQC